MAICSVEGCGCKAYIKVSDQQSETFHLSFKGDIHHPRGTIAARRMTSDVKEHF